MQILEKKLQFLDTITYVLWYKKEYSDFQKKKKHTDTSCVYLCNQSIFLVPQEVIFGFWLDSLLRMFYVFLRVGILHLEVETSPFVQEVGQV